MNDSDERLDIYVSREKGFSREYAKEIIKNGKVSVNQKIITKSSVKVSSVDSIIILADKPKYVSRGGLKLEKAIDCFGLALSNKLCLDIGASTGGFTDCMIQNGAKLVYAVDGGKEQLSPTLKLNPKVISFEETLIQDFTNVSTEKDFDFISVDVSFVSVTRILNNIYDLLDNDGNFVMLVKPQFEAGKENIGRSGVVKNPKVHKKVIVNIVDKLKENNLHPINIDYSPIKGQNGNIEYLIHGKKIIDTDFSIKNIDNIVEKAYNDLY